MKLNELKIQNLIEIKQNKEAVKILIYAESVYIFKNTFDDVVFNTFIEMIVNEPFKWFENAINFNNSSKFLNLEQFFNVFNFEHFQDYVFNYSQINLLDEEGFFIGTTIEKYFFNLYHYYDNKIINCDMFFNLLKSITSKAIASDFNELDLISHIINTLEFVDCAELRNISFKQYLLDKKVNIEKEHLNLLLKTTNKSNKILV